MLNINQTSLSSCYWILSAAPGLLLLICGAHLCLVRANTPECFSWLFFLALISAGECWWGGWLKIISAASLINYYNLVIIFAFQLKFNSSVKVFEHLPDPLGPQSSPSAAARPTINLLWTHAAAPRLLLHLHLNLVPAVNHWCRNSWFIYLKKMAPFQLHSTGQNQELPAEDTGDLDRMPWAKFVVI